MTDGPEPTPTDEASTEQRQKTSAELLGELAGDLALLSRTEIELAAAESGPQVRQVAVEVAVALCSAVALLFALAALSWAAVQGLTLEIPSWSASLVVAAGWAVVAVLLALLDHPRRLLRRLAKERSVDAIKTAERDRAVAEEAVLTTAERLGSALVREAAERELGEDVDAMEGMVEGAEEEAEDLLKELVVAFLAPGKAGISLLERIVSRQGEQ